MSTISGENAYSYVGTPVGNLDLWYIISDLQVNPNATEVIFIDVLTNKIRKIDFLSSNLLQFELQEKSSPPKKNLSLSNLLNQKKEKASISTIAGSGYTGSQNGNPLVASFNYASSIAIDWIISPNIIYVSDTGNNCTRKINQTSSIVSTFAGNCSANGYQDGPLLSALFSMPFSIRYLSTSFGTKLLVVDSGNSVIRMIDITSG